VNKNKRIEFLLRLRAANPKPRTELRYKNPFELLVAVTLSAQATDRSVNNATQELFKVANTPEAILALGVGGLKPYIKSIGLFNSKAKNIVAACHLLVDEYESRLPETREELERLPGVGRKTANVILNTAFGHPTIAVDTHIFRVANRTGFALGKTVRKVEEQLHKVVPNEFKYNAHHWFLLHGRYICVARKPKCKKCPVSEICDYREKSK